MNDVILGLVIGWSIGIWTVIGLAYLMGLF